MTTLRMTDRSVRDELLLLRQYRADLGHHPDPDKHVDAEGPALLLEALRDHVAPT